MMCPLCNHETRSLGAVDFNRGCFHSLPASGEMIEYRKCDQCAVIFAPEMCAWSKDQYMARVYNDDYVLVDPEINGVRARRNADWMLQSFGSSPGISHLDYGGSNGELAEALREAGWDSTSYDPMSDEPFPDRKFDLVTAFEVFEHAPNPSSLMLDLSRVTGDTLLFSTATNDKAVDPLDWWYLAPRNGHVMLYSKRSLSDLLSRSGLRLSSIDDGSHFGLLNPSSILNVVSA